MLQNLINGLRNFYVQNIVQYMNDLYLYPSKLISLILDLIIVGYVIYKFIKVIKDTKVWQLIKGILILIVITALSEILNLYLTNYLLRLFLTWGWGVVAIVVIFQPEIRKALEKLGTNKITKFLGMDKEILTKAKEDIYKVTIATTELAKTKTGALMVFERDIRIDDIIETGIKIDAEVSPQLLVNIFVKNTPLHDGAVIISNNRITSAACILPLSDSSDISKKLGTRHRAALGISKESDAIVVVVSEETGKISVAKDGKLITDLQEDSLKKILMKNLVINVINQDNKKIGLKDIKNKFKKK